ncbi:trypsin-like peptidase domain-containing protein [Rhodopirellula sp.]|nr:trypsin-like peptidase domain-containing protein [Rubripirellula sp.]MDA7874315.1 trypsin-like peptidase domain-containing protein [Rhodopirellula sp.]MDB4621944.1 trypsin-like peptidase domain-containing protein [Rubripirellula sp.]
MRTIRTLVALFCFSGWIHTASADFDVTELQSSIQQTIDAVQPAVVAIRGSRSAFSGVIVSSDGHILSAGHAVKPGSRYQVILPDGRRLRARGKGSNPKADCALVQITEKIDDLPFVQIGESANLVANQPCIGISFPGGQGTREQPAVRFGRIVRGARRGGMLQSTALMEPGDSGGALFDLDGRVIGIHSRIGTSMSQNFEVPINVYKNFWTELNNERSFTSNSRMVLGIIGREREDGSGITVEEVVDDSVASKSDIQVDDIIKVVYGKETASTAQLRKALAAASDKRLVNFSIVIQRADEELTLDVDFSNMLPPPDLALPKYEPKTFSIPEPIKQLADLPREFSELEDQLDDACLLITSEFGTSDDTDSLDIAGTLIKDTDLVVSKNSMVGANPTAKSAGKTVKLKIVGRDTENDLILLRTPEKHSDGISLAKSVDDEPLAGVFLIAPDASGSGQVSIISAKTFKSQKEMSRGFLGVVPAAFENQGGAVLNEVRPDGAAKKAGLKVGDVVIKMNDTLIETDSDMRSFLTKVDPKVTIIAKIKRDGKEIEKSITLGAYPSSSRHAADNMDKSGRRDGFSTVILHDANLQTDKCGGPIFDLSGNFLGMNIARNSRVRSYALPSSVIKAFVDAQN